MGVPVTTTKAELIAEFQRLDTEYHSCNRRIELALLRQRFAAGAEEVECAVAAERKWLRELDLVMTRLRAVEHRLIEVEKTAK